MSGHDLVGEVAPSPGRGRLLVAAQGKAVLEGPGDAVLVGQDLRSVAQGHRPAIGMARVDEPPPQRGGVHLLVAALIRPLGLGHHPRGPAHRLDTAGDANLGVADRDGPAGPGNGLQARSAQPVGGGPRHRGRHAGQQGGHAGHVAVLLARAVAVAKVDVVDRSRIQGSRAVEQGRHHSGGQVVGADRGQTPADLPDRRPHGVDDVDGSGHWPVPTASAARPGGPVPAERPTPGPTSLRRTGKNCTVHRFWSSP